MKKLIIVLLLILTSNIYSQKVYYTTDGKIILSKGEIDKMSEDIKIKFTKILKKEVFVNLTFLETVEKQDSIIHKISFDIRDKKSADDLKNNPLLKLKNNEFPKFNLEILLGGNFDSEKLKGKPTMINFWFTKCAPCIDEMPILNSPSLQN